MSKSRGQTIPEAKGELYEVAKEAAGEGPQILTRRGGEVAVILSLDEYLQLERKKTEFFRQSPDRSPVRPAPKP